MDFLEAPIVIEQKILAVNECFVYQVPPLRTASGHRAEEWGLDKPVFTGHLKMLQADTKMRIVVYRYKDEKTLLSSDENLIQFAECPIEIEPKEEGAITKYVDSVADSSRYFVIRVKDPNSTRTLHLGIGFRERDTAFDFKNALNEFVRYVDRMSTAEEMHKKIDELEEEQATERGSGDHVAMMKDLSIKEGEKIHINVSTHHHHHHTRDKHTAGNSGGLLALRPPPPPGSVVGGLTAPSHPEPVSAPAASPATTSSVAEDEWGEFTS